VNDYRAWWRNPSILQEYSSFIRKSVSNILMLNSEIHSLPALNKMPRSPFRLRNFVNLLFRLIKARVRSAKVGSFQLSGGLPS
jgi:hypothetical protein